MNAQAAKETAKLDSSFAVCWFWFAVFWPFSFAV
jgi:hypothetical protein